MDYDRYFIKEVCEQMTFYKENKLTLLCCSGAKVICFSLLWQILMDFFSPVKNEEKERKRLLCVIHSVRGQTSNSGVFLSLFILLLLLMLMDENFTLLTLQK